MPWRRRLLSYVLDVVVVFVVLLGVALVWDYTNSPEFCGTTCHTMPPEYAAYQVSPHARVACVDCHIGRGFIATRITRKAGDIQHVTATLFSSYEYPIFADALRPARETCEKCHYPTKFSDDSLRQNVRFMDDEDNTRYSIFLAMRTGGGTQREGLGRGIHWHVENEVYFVATDELEQEIPYVRVVGVDGSETVYTALDSDLTEEELAEMEQSEMDCITCHNRISHYILPPDVAVDKELFRNQIDADIPYIRENAVEVLSETYASDEAALDAITALDAYYAENHPGFYDESEASVDAAVDALVAVYEDTVFLDQKIDWRTHPNNVGHEDWPGCFRCHDGQHVSEAGEAIRLECNLCHSIPLLVTPGTIEPELPLVSGIQPDSHFSTHWIALHRESFDQSCQACHDVSNPGGTDNASFCSNAMCHGVAWEYANLDAPGLAQVLAAEMPEEPPAAEPPPEEPPAEEASAAVEEGEVTLTFADVEPAFTARCSQCHNVQTMTGGLVVNTYDALMAGGDSGEVIVPGDAEASLLVQVQRENHFAAFDDEEMQLVIDWINAGAAPAPPLGLGFDEQIGPMLQENCRTCHGEGVAAGGLVVETYDALMAGSDNGPVVEPDSADASLIVQVQTGEHYANLTPEDLQLLIDWIDQGAPQQAEPLGADAPTFEAIIEPLFESRCGTCHSEVVASGGLVLTKYDSILEGGDDGAVIVPGNPEASLIVQVQRGGHYADLDDDELALVIEWIANGAP
jgi:nitrate/TMAO reductase-like tetraheme cytochrome c subunit